MSADAPLPIDMLPIDYADHTLEVDIRWLLAEQAKQTAGNDAGDTDDLHAVPDLSADQVDALLNPRK